MGEWNETALWTQQQIPSSFEWGKEKREEGKKQFNHYIIPSAMVCKG